MRYDDDKNLEYCPKRSPTLFNFLYFIGVEVREEPTTCKPLSDAVLPGIYHGARADKRHESAIFKFVSYCRLEALHQPLLVLPFIFSNMVHFDAMFDKKRFLHL